MRYRDADHYAPPDDPAPGAAEFYAEEAEAWERGKEQAKAAADPRFDGAELTLLLYWANAHLATMNRLLLTDLPAGRAVIVRTELATTRRIVDKLRGWV